MRHFWIFKRLGYLGAFAHLYRISKQKSGWEKFRFRNVEKYHDPTQQELERIESDLIENGIQVEDYEVNPDSFKSFSQKNPFPPDYHGGRDGGVWDEKLLEHYIATELLSLNDFGPNDIYIDVAAGGSPWVLYLRKKLKRNAYAVDVKIDKKTYDYSFYREESATSLNFANGSIRGASLHCAYEMFKGNDDVDFIKEIARVLVPGGKVIIVPLYMHTHYCAFSTPEYWGKGHSDPNAKEYVRLNFHGIPSARNYNVEYLRKRVLDPAGKAGLRYRILKLRNKSILGQNIYCHFILELTR